MGGSVPPLDERAPAGGDDERRRVEELLRVNERLAAEIRSLAAGRTQAPRSDAMTAARRLAALSEERDALRDLLAATQERLAAVESHATALEATREELLREVGRLRGGLRGLLRRALARPFR